VVNKVVGEKFLEHFEIPMALHFFGISSDYSLRGIG
jgi:hypothetical protein